MSGVTFGSVGPRPTPRSFKPAPRVLGAISGLAITNSSPAGAKGSPVLLCNGLLNFQIPLLSSMAAGTGSFSFALDYVAGGTGTTSSDGTVGLNFNYPQNAVLIQSGSNVILQLGENTQELFNYVSPGVYSSSANNSRTLMTRTASGTSADQFTLVSGDGVVSIFSGFYSSITTPGRLKTMTDRFGNSMGFTWQLVGGLARLTSVTDSYGRTSYLTYSGSGSLLQQVTDFWGRQVNLQYDSSGRLLAVVGPSVTRGANNNANIFPNGTAWVFQYDTGNSRPARQNDLIKIWHPNQVAPYVSSSRSVNTASVYASATPRQQISYYNDPTDTFQYGKVEKVIESATGSGSTAQGRMGTCISTAACLRT